MDSEHRTWFLNAYRCDRCAFEWQDTHDACPDDDCPRCGRRHLSPIGSVLLDGADEECRPYVVHAGDA